MSTVAVVSRCVLDVRNFSVTGSNVSVGARRRQGQPGTEPGGPMSAFSL